VFGGAGGDEDNRADGLFGSTLAGLAASERAADEVDDMGERYTQQSESPSSLGKGETRTQAARRLEGGLCRRRRGLQATKGGADSKGSDQGRESWDEHAGYKKAGVNVYTFLMPAARCPGGPEGGPNAIHT